MYKLFTLTFISHSLSISLKKRIILRIYSMPVLSVKKKKSWCQRGSSPRHTQHSTRHTCLIKVLAIPGTSCVSETQCKIKEQLPLRSTFNTQGQRTHFAQTNNFEFVVNTYILLQLLDSELILVLQLLYNKLLNVAVLSPLYPPYIFILQS